MTTANASNRSTPASNLRRPALEDPTAARPPAAAAGAEARAAVEDVAIDVGLELLAPGTGRAARDTYELAKGVYEAAQVLGRDTRAAHLAVGEAATMELGVDAVLPEGMFLEIAGTLGVEREAQGYKVEAELGPALGVGGKLAEGLEAKLGGTLGVKVAYAAKDAAAADERVAAVERAALTALGRSMLPPVPLVGGGVIAFATAFDDVLDGAVEVETRVGGKAALEAKLWESPPAAVAAELGLAFEGAAELAVIVKDEDGKKTVSIEQRLEVDAELEVALEHAPLDELTIGGVHGPLAQKVTFVDRRTWSLPADFPMTSATDVVALVTARKSEPTRALELQTEAHVRGQLVETKLTVDGGARDALVVAAAALGVDGAENAARKVRVRGEVERSSAIGEGATINFADIVEGEASVERTRTLEKVEVKDVRGFLAESVKASATATLNAAARIGR